MKKDTENTLVSFSEAGRILNLSRQRVQQLINANRFTLPTLESGEVIPHRLYIEEVRRHVRLAGGRPKKQRSDEPFDIGNSVEWTPQKGKKKQQILRAEVVKIGKTRVKLSIKEGENISYKWANKDSLVLI